MMSINLCCKQQLVIKGVVLLYDFVQSDSKDRCN